MVLATDMKQVCFACCICSRYEPIPVSILLFMLPQVVLLTSCPHPFIPTRAMRIYSTFPRFRCSTPNLRRGMLTALVEWIALPRPAAAPRRPPDASSWTRTCGAWHCR